MSNGGLSSVVPIILVGLFAGLVGAGVMFGIGDTIGVVAGWVLVVAGGLMVQFGMLAGAVEYGVRRAQQR